MGIVLSSPIVHVAPAVIRWARVSAGIHIDEAARSAHVEPALLAKWERSEATPTARQLERLADPDRQTSTWSLAHVKRPNEPQALDEYVRKRDFTKRVRWRRLG